MHKSEDLLQEKDPPVAAALWEITAVVKGDMPSLQLFFLCGKKPVRALTNPGR